jgi:hypothetical protein
MAVLGNSCFWLVYFLKSSLKLLGQMNGNLVGSIWLDQVKVYQIDICYFVANPTALMSQDFVSEWTCGDLLKNVKGSWHIQYSTSCVNLAENKNDY